MKRSEAVALIKEKLSGQTMDTNWVYVILDTVEEIGMLPPKIKMGTNELILVSEWEPE